MGTKRRREHTWLVEHILENWDEWDAEASQAAQNEQGHAAWLDVMRDHLHNACERSHENNIANMKY